MIGTVLLAIVGIVLMILVVVGFHELGHFLTAKWVGVRVDEFAIGFGPKLWGRRRGETLYALRALPLGGYVKMPGMSALEEHDAGERAFNRVSRPRRMVVILAGVTFNFILAAVLWSIVAIPGQPSSVSTGGPLTTAGLGQGDLVTQVGSQPISTGDPGQATTQLHAATEATQGRPTTVRYLASGSCPRQVGTQDGKPLCETTVTPMLVLINLNGDNPLPQQTVVTSIDGRPVGSGDPGSLFANRTPTVSGYQLGDPGKQVTGQVSGVGTAHGGGDLGQVEAAWRLGYGPGFVSPGIPAAIATGFGQVPRTVADTFTGLWQVISTPHSGGTRNFQGPVGIAANTAGAVQQGILPYLSWMAFISLNLGIVNLLPIPFLDGGRFVLILVEGIRRRAMDPRREMALIIAGMAIVVAFVVFITIGDIQGHS